MIILAWTSDAFRVAYLHAIRHGEASGRMRSCFNYTGSRMGGANVGSGNTYSINKLVKLIGGEIEYIPKRPGEPDCTFADISKIRDLLNWEPQIGFEEGVKKMIENIDYWQEAPLWDRDSIAVATQDWFRYLSK